MTGLMSEEPTHLTPEQELIFEKNLVWVLSSPRSGSTWLAKELLSNQTTVLDEPYLGFHLASLGAITGNSEMSEQHRNRPDYFFSKDYETSWKFYLRKLILNRIFSQFTDLSKKILIKEPNGSEGSDNILRCLPSSKFILVLRDGRDVVDSLLDSRLPGGWNTNEHYVLTVTQETKNEFMKRFATHWKNRMKILLDAYENHPKELRIKLRYEDLRTNTTEELIKLYDFIGIETPKHVIDELIEMYKFENVPKEDKGPGKGKRYASPGLWKENFTNDEKKILEELMGDTLRSLGYE